MNIPLNLRLFAAAVLLLSLYVIVRTSQRSRMEIQDATNWVFVTLGLLLSVVFPEVVRLVSRTLGFEVTSNAIFVALFFLVFAIVYYLNIRISRLAVQLKEAIQNISLLEKRLRDAGFVSPIHSIVDSKKDDLLLKSR